MNSILRAAGFAAASLLAVFGVPFTGSSYAWEANPAPVIASPIAHAAAAPIAADLIELPSETAADAATPAPALIAEHAAAALPQPEALPEEEPRQLTLAEMVAQYSTSETDDREHECLAGAVYFESKGEPLAGQLAVAEVVLNRARSGRFPPSVCGVVKQKGQFSFIRNGGFPPIARSSAAWKKAVAVARIARVDLADGAAPKALFFHARYVSPGWRGLTRVASVGNHIFYR